MLQECIKAESTHVVTIYSNKSKSVQMIYNCVTGGQPAGEPCKTSMDRVYDSSSDVLQ